MVFCRVEEVHILTEAERIGFDSSQVDCSSADCNHPVLDSGKNAGLDSSADRRNSFAAEIQVLDTNDYSTDMTGAAADTSVAGLDNHMKS